MLHLKIDNKILVNILVQISLIGIIHYVYNEKSFSIRAIFFISIA